MPVIIGRPFKRFGNQYYKTILADTPFAYWRLGETSGIVANDELGTNDGTYVGSPTLGSAGAITGDADTAVLFNGTTDYMEVPNIEVIPTTGDFSVEAWLKPASQSGSVYRGADGFGAGWSFNMFVGNTVASNNLLLTVPGDVTVTVQLFQTYSQTEFYHCVSVFKEGTGLYFYVNGVELGFSPSTSTTLRSSTRGMFLGVSNPIVPRNGYVDEVATYHYALTPQQVLNHYNAGI